MVGFFAVILAVLVLLHVYLWKRLVRDPLRPGRARRAGGLVVLLLGVLVPATLIGTRTGRLGWLAWPGYVWIGLMFYLFVILLVLEVPRLVIALAGRARRRSAEPVPVTAGATAPARVEADHSGAADSDRRLFLARGTAILAGVTAAGISGYGVRTALGPPGLDRVRLPLAKLPRSMDGTRLAVVSDIHLGPLTGSHHVGRIVDMINSVDADIVCVVGDLVDGTVPELGRYAEPLAGIRSKRGAYFVTGNHEYYSGFQPWIDEVASLGVRPLRNERLELDGLDLAGVNDLGGADAGDAPDFAKALGDRDSARPVVLMAHQPIMARQAARYGVDLQVSGHTHGGQMVPFNLLVGLQQPLVSGFGRMDGVPVYVTNGAGFWGPPMRVGAPPQVSVIDLHVP